MDNKDIDIELINAFTLEITDRLKLILESFPDRKSEVLKHLAASSIHLAFFMHELNNYIHKVDYSKEDKEIEERFLNSCGCN